MNKDLLSQLASKGDKTFEKSNFPKIPGIKLDGLKDSETYGQFVEWLGKDEGNKPHGDTLRIQIIRTKKRLEAATDSGKYYSNEYDSPKHDIIKLKFAKFEKGSADEKPALVAEGTPENIRAAHDDLKTITVAYGILDGRLVKIDIKGASAAGDNGFYEYANKFTHKDSDNMMFCETVINSKFVQKNRAVSYYKMEFTKGGASIDPETLEKIGNYLDIVNGETAMTATEAEATAVAVDKEFDEAW